MTKVMIGSDTVETRAEVAENRGTSALIEDAVRHDEGRLAKDGPLVVATGRHTGRSAKDKFIVQDDETRDTIWWGKTNVAMTPDQAMYHFLSGYTARVAGTEIGVTEPEATFSTCFGAPFMPRHPSVYGNLLKDRIARGGVQCWLVNTGWTGGMATMDGIKRMPIKATRALLNAALDGSLNEVEFRTDPYFGFEVPVSVPGVDSAILNPRETWADKEEYDATANRLVAFFIENFMKFEAHVDQQVKEAAPHAA